MLHSTPSYPLSSTVPGKATVLVPPGYVVRHCHACGTRLVVPFDRHTDIHSCPVCKHSDAEKESQWLLADVQRLVAGHGPFDVLTPEERASFIVDIAALVQQDHSPDPATRREIEAYCDDVDRMTESRRGLLTAFSAA